MRSSAFVLLGAENARLTRRTRLLPQAGVCSSVVPIVFAHRVQRVRRRRLEMVGIAFGDGAREDPHGPRIRLRVMRRWRCEELPVPAWPDSAALTAIIERSPWTGGLCPRSCRVATWPAVGLRCSASAVRRIFDQVCDEFGEGAVAGCGGVGAEGAE